MSIALLEGFDLYGNWGNYEQDPFVRRDAWFHQELIYDASFKAVNNGHAMRLDTGVTGNLTHYRTIYLQSQDIVSTRKIVCGFSFEKESVGATNDNTPWLISFNLGDNTTYFTISLLSNPSVDFNIIVTFNNGGSYVEAEIPNIAIGIRHFIEFEVNNDAQPHMKVWLNGSLQIDADGPAAFANPFTSFTLHAAKDNYHPGGIWYDDFYLLDALDASQGAQFQSRLGPIQIRPCPLTADSIPGSWVASSGGAKYLDVDEQPGPNDLDATYISTITAPQTQVFRCSPYDADLPIIAVTSFAAVKQPDPTNGVAQLSFMVDDQEDPSPLPLQNVYRLFSQNYVTLPGGSITVPVIQATDWGVRALPS